jgi:hypothetical protein
MGGSFLKCLLNLLVRVSLLAVLFLLVAACSGGSREVSERPTTTGATASGTAAATSVADEASLDLVVVGDSFVGWSDWPQMYADLASDSLGMAIVVDESLAASGTPRRLDQIKDSASAQDVIRSAEILVVQPQPGFVAEPVFSAYLDGECGGELNTECFAAAAEEYLSYSNEYFDLLLELVKPGTIIRVAVTGTWGPDGFYPELRENGPEALFGLIEGIHAIMTGTENAAVARGIPTIDVSAAFNGPTYRDLAPPDYLVADRLHLADKGSQVVAELLHQLGYDPKATD